MSPPASTSAFLQSIMPAPVRSRSSLTICAVTCIFEAPSSSGRYRAPDALDGANGGSFFRGASSTRPSPRDAVPRAPPPDVGGFAAGRPSGSSAAARERSPLRSRLRGRRGALGGLSRRRGHQLAFAAFGDHLLLEALGAVEIGVGDLRREQPDRRGSRRRCPGSRSRSARGRSWCRRSRSPGCRACWPRRPRSYSFFGSTTNSASGSASMSRMPSRLRDMRSRSRSRRRRSFLVRSVSSSPSRDSMLLELLDRRCEGDEVGQRAAEPAVGDEELAAAPGLLGDRRPGPAAWCRRTGSACRRRRARARTRPRPRTARGVFCRSMM